MNDTEFMRQHHFGLALDNLIKLALPEPDDKEARMELAKLIALKARWVILNIHPMQAQDELAKDFTRAGLSIHADSHDWDI